MSATTVMFLGPILRERPTVYERALKDKSYRRSPVGQQVGRYLRALRWSDHAANTIDAYETVLSRLALDHDDYAGIEDFANPVGTEYLREFLDRHWGNASPATRRQRLAAVKSFMAWGRDEGLIEYNPAAPIRPPRQRGPETERIAYAIPILLKLVRGQTGLREQCALQLLCRMALRKNELRVMRVGEIDLIRNLIVVHGKGGGTRIMPLEYKTLRSDLYAHVQGEERASDEYLIYPRSDRKRPMDPASIHRWFKRCLTAAGLPDTVTLHELRHSAADNLWRGSGDIVMAQQLLRHKSISTTQAYLHPTREDLADAMRSLDGEWS